MKINTTTSTTRPGYNGATEFVEICLATGKWEIELTPESLEILKNNDSVTKELTTKVFMCIDKLFEEYKKGCAK